MKLSHCNRLPPHYYATEACLHIEAVFQTLSYNSEAEMIEGFFLLLVRENSSYSKDNGENDEAISTLEVIHTAAATD